MPKTSNFFHIFANTWVFCLFLLFCFFKTGVSLTSPGSTGTHSIEEARLEFRDLPDTKPGATPSSNVHEHGESAVGHCCEETGLTLTQHTRLTFD